jgi:hypothetical protein
MSQKNKTYNITFITNSEQLSPYTKVVISDSASEARDEIMSCAQIPARFIKSCKRIK